MNHRFNIEFTKKALKALLKIPTSIRGTILQKIDLLATDPYNANNNIKQLKTDAIAYRLRIGDYRVIFVLDPLNKLITIVNIAHRKEVYR